MATKYIGWTTGQDDERGVSAAEVLRVIRANRQYGTVRETLATCRRILRRGDTLGDGSGYVVRLRRRAARGG